MDAHVTGIPEPPEGLSILGVAYRTPKKGEWFLSRYSDSWVLNTNKNKRQRHLTIKVDPANQGKVPNA